MSVTFLDLPGGRTIAELAVGAPPLHSASDASEVIGNASFQGADAMLLHASLLPSDFFDLSSGVAGEILQKFANYRLRVAIVGSCDVRRSASVQAWIAESNRGNSVIFAPDREEALARLAR